MNITNLIVVLQQKMAATTDPYEQQLATKTIDLLKTNKVNYVDTFADLPTASTSYGQMYFVDADVLIYWSDGANWIGLNIPFKGSVAYGWGCNQNGILGDGTATNRPVPVLVCGSALWCQVSAGRVHSLGIQANGSAWAWGFNTHGQLGDVTTVSKSSPVSVVGGFTDWCQVSAGGCHSLGLRQNGTAWAWGANFNGSLGDGTIVSKSSPVSVVGGFTDWCQVSAGGTHSLGLRQNGSAWAWGQNTHGQLGDATTVGKSSPVSVVGGFTDWCQVSAGRVHSLGLRQDGTLWAWGYNLLGQLGNNSTYTQSSPVSVVGGFTDWCQVSASASTGVDHSLGVRQNGTAWAWGGGTSGQLGNNAATNRSSPVSVVGGFTDWCQVSAGAVISTGLRQNGTVWAWGRNIEGNLGDGTTTQRTSPVSVVGGLIWCQVSSGAGSIAISLTDY